MNHDIHCNNCGKLGHNYSQCKIPITSYGVIAFRYNKENAVEYLMICRKDTLGFIDFMRGKYVVQNKNYIMNMFKQMTVNEKELLIAHDFDFLWKKLWGNTSLNSQYRSEEYLSKEKFNMLSMGVFNNNEYFSLKTLVEESNQYYQWNEPEWGFPKGRRNYQEKDFECAVREFCEETGYKADMLRNVQNILPFEEIFTGSNYKSYKHKYYLMNIDYDISLLNVIFDSTEVSNMKWCTYEECIKNIRPYNLEKCRLLTNINNCFTKYNFYYSQNT